jgi:molybdenum cofactor guanylyltransferase
VVDAVILAGGRAARLGGIDKPGLEVGGRTLLGTVVTTCQDAGAGQIVVVGPEQAELSVRFVREEPAGAGPWPALRRGLAELTGLAGLAGPGAGDQVAVLAADLPFLRAPHLLRLLEAAEGHAGAVLLDDEDQPQWLTGCWHRGCLQEAADRYQGSTLRGLMRPLEPARVRIEPAPGEPPPWLDCDTGADLARARAWRARLPGALTGRRARPRCAAAGRPRTGGSGRPRTAWRPGRRRPRPRPRAG